jgi:2-methylcitrate dehydratase
VQNLLIRVTVLPSKDYSAAFPAEMPCRLTLTLRDGRVLEKEKKDYEGFLTRPMRWETVLQKFNRLAARYADDRLRHEIAGAVARLEEIRVRDLMKLLAEVRIPG